MTAALLSVALLFLSANPGTHPASDDWVLDRQEKQLPVGDHARIEITNEFGDLRCRAGAVDQIEIIANAQQRAGDSKRAEITVQEIDGKLILGARFVGGDSESAEMRQRRIDITVLIPARRELSLKTIDGLLEAKGLEGPLTASTRAGNMNLSTSGTLRLATERGKIKVDFKSSDWAKPPHIETQTGDVELWFPHDANFTLSARTKGRITTDYSVSIEEIDYIKQVAATVGEGGPSLQIESARGDLKLHRSRP